MQTRRTTQNGGCLATRVRGVAARGVDLPSTLPHDYGIDGEVEIFSGDAATGLIFKVQLKGTRRDVRTVRLSHDKASYYASLSVPVLIVLWHGPSGRVFARWFQSFDPHDEPPTEQSIGLSFRDGDEVTVASVASLLRDMEIHRRLSDPASALPLELLIVREDDTVAGLPSASLALGFRDASSHLPDVYRITDTETPNSVGTLTIRSESVTISLRGLLSSTVHYPDPWPDDPDVQLVLNDAIVMLSVLINRLGRYDVSARLFAEHALGSSVIQNEQTTALVAGALIRTHRIQDAIRILEGLAGTDAFDWMLLAISLAWTGMADYSDGARARIRPGVPLQTS